MRHFSYQTKSH